jgi:hypothetical protein
MPYVKIGPHYTRQGFCLRNITLWLRRGWHQAFGHPGVRKCDYVAHEFHCDRCMAFLVRTPHGDFYGC